MDWADRHTQIRCSGTIWEQAWCSSGQMVEDQSWTTLNTSNFTDASFYWSMDLNLSWSYFLAWQSPHRRWDRGIGLPLWVREWETTCVVAEGGKCEVEWVHTWQGPHRRHRAATVSQRMGDNLCSGWVVANVVPQWWQSEAEWVHTWQGLRWVEKGIGQWRVRRWGLWGGWQWLTTKHGTRCSVFFFDCDDVPAWKC